MGIGPTNLGTLVGLVQSAIAVAATYVTSASKGAASGVAPLDSGSKLLWSYLANISANKLIGSVAGGSPEEIACTAAGRALLDDADAAAQRTTLGLFLNVSCQVYKAALQAIATGTHTALTFDTERNDNGGMWAIGNPTRFTAPADGIYLMSVSIEWSGAGNNRSLGIRVNGSGNDVVRVYNAGDLMMHLSYPVKMTAAQYAEFYVWQGSGGNLDIIRTADSSLEATVVRIA